jgi:NADH-quinone oxidoreductase subunit N
VAEVTSRSSPLLVIGLGLLIVGFGFKVALVPFHMWTPDVYQGAPTSVTAFMSVGAKAAGFAALGRVLIYALVGQAQDWSPVLAVLAVLTMTLGNVVAVSQTNLKRMLAYSSIAHAGYILIGVAAATSSGGAALLFYLLVYAFMNMGAFGVVIAVGKGDNSGENLEDYAGLSFHRPFLAAAMAIFMLSLAGVPPLAGFWGKLYIFSAAVEAGLAVLAVVGVINSAISAYFYLRVIVYMYLRPSSGEAIPAIVPPALVVATVLAALGTVLLGLWPSPLVSLAQRSIMAMLGG